MEKCCKSYNVNILMGVKKFAKPFKRMCSCFRLTNVKCYLRLNVPFIYHRIIHMYRIPHNVSKKTNRIFMERSTVINSNVAAFLVIIPRSRCNYFTRSSVNNLPPSCDIVTVIYFKHIRIKIIHKMN